MNISGNEVVVIDPNIKKSEEIKSMLQKSMKNVAVINQKCLFDQFQRINQLMNNHAYLKIFYGGSEKSFNEMLLNFGLKDDENSIYIGLSLKIRKIAISYWKHRSKIGV